MLDVVVEGAIQARLGNRAGDTPPPGHGVGIGVGIGIGIGGEEHLRPVLTAPAGGHPDRIDGQNLPAAMSLVVTRDTWYVVATRAWPGVPPANDTGMPVVALSVTCSTYPDPTS